MCVSVGWPGSLYVAKADLEFLMLLPLPLSAGITGLCTIPHFCSAEDCILTCARQALYHPLSHIPHLCQGCSETVLSAEQKNRCQVFSQLNQNPHAVSGCGGKTRALGEPEISDHHKVVKTLMNPLERKMGVV